MKLAIVKHRMAGLFRQANNPFIKCNFHSFFFHIPQREGNKNVHWMCLLAASLCATLSHTMSHLLLTRFFCVCMCVYIWVCTCSCPCVHMQRSEEDNGYLQDRISHCTGSLTILAWLPGHLTPGTWLSSPHNAEVTSTWSCAQIFDFIYFLCILGFIFPFYWK